MITSKVRQSLQDLSPQHYARLQVIESKAHQLVEFSQGGSHLTFTPHGISHISAVERNYDWLISDSDLPSFNATELFCLICATLFHDALMIPHRVGDERQAREHHVKRAREFLIAERNSLGLGIQEADLIAQVIRGHEVYNLEELPSRVVLGNELVDIRKLGACLSLADICHADASRAPEIVFRHLDLDDESAFHWRRHMQISGITRIEDTILMSALTFSEQGDVAVKDYKTEIEKQLTIVKPYFDSILKPIRRIDLELRRLESPLDQTLQFHANTPEILRILIQGVYDREDVFIRELVQNSLDSCLVRRAKQFRRNSPYEPYVLITAFMDYAKDELRAIRVDDNGIGMDITDVQDTVLWIGNSVSSNTEVANLLQETFGKNLIATFGIGLLSCFKASANISIRTKKENETPLQFSLTGVSDNIKPEKCDDETVGTTVMVDLIDRKGTAIDEGEAIDHYFRQVTQVNLAYMELEWGQDLIELSRDEIFKIARTEATSITPTTYFVPDSDQIGLQVHGDDFSGSIWIESPNVAEIYQQGFVRILNDGIFVTEERTIDWLPPHLSFCNAVLNFSPGAISLPAGRDRVIKDQKFRQKQKLISEKAYGLIDVLVGQTRSKAMRRRDFAALALALIYKNADEEAEASIFKRLDNYHANVYRREERIKLSDIEGKVYLQYPQGRYVTELGDVDGNTLYYKADDLVALRAAMMVQDGYLVLATVRDDSVEEPTLEADLISAFLEFSNREVVDLVTTDVLGGKQRSKPVPTVVRQELGSVVKFVDMAELPNKKAWPVGAEIWINVANPSMKEVYTKLVQPDVSDLQIGLCLVLFNILCLNFDESVRDLLTMINEQ